MPSRLASPLAAGVLLLALATAARASALRALTLPQALDYAREHQPSLVAARARISASAAAAEIPRGLSLPHVDASAQVFGATANNSTAAYVHAYGLDVPRVGGTKVGDVSFAPSASTFAAVGARQELFDFGRIAALDAEADAELDSTRRRADAERLDVALAVEEAFFAVEAAKAVLSSSQAALDRARANRDYATAGVRSGLRKPIDETRAEADFARFDAGRIRALGGVTISQALFAAVVGVPEALLDAAVEANGAAANGAAANGAAANGADAGGATPADATTIDEALSKAAEREPAVRAAEAEIAAQSARTVAIAGELRPDLSLTAALSTRAGGAIPSTGPGQSGLVPDVPNWDVGLVVSWPLYDASTRAREEASRRQEDVRRAELAEVKQRLGALVEQSFVALSVARDAVPALERTVEAARANDDQAQARFKAGLGTSVELADAEALLVDSEIQLALGRFDAARARARLGRALAEGL